MRKRDGGTKQNRGFTLVELVIVIAVIAILTTISLISYVSTQNQAKGEKARTNAASVKSAAEAYYNTANTYPTQVSHFSSTFATLPSDITILTSGSLTSTNGESSIMYRYTGGGTGACIMHWEFAPDSRSPGAVALDHLGSATSGNCNATTGSFPG